MKNLEEKLEEATEVASYNQAILDVGKLFEKSPHRLWSSNEVILEVVDLRKEVSEETQKEMDRIHMNEETEPNFV